jgi:putative DeoR family transcriptional regulator (stage III sporulation protein D)
MELSCFIAERKATVRQAAKHFGVSKSTVHKDVTERLPDLNRDLAAEVKLVLEVNRAERHIRGGEATKKKYSVH